MSIVSTIGNIYFVYQFLKKLVTPFEKTKAFELGIIDEKGKILKRRRDLKTKDEKEAYTLSDTLIWNIKKLLGKVPGGQSRIASYATPHCSLSKNNMEIIRLLMKSWRINSLISLNRCIIMTIFI